MNSRSPLRVEHKTLPSIGACLAFLYPQKLAGVCGPQSSEVILVIQQSGLTIVFCNVLYLENGHLHLFCKVKRPTIGNKTVGLYAATKMGSSGLGDVPVDESLHDRVENVLAQLKSNRTSLYRKTFHLCVLKGNP